MALPDHFRADERLAEVCRNLPEWPRLAHRKSAATGGCQAYATIGHLAGAETVMEPTGRMGMSTMWAWDEREAPQTFPASPWPLPLSMADSPYPKDHHGHLERHEER